MEQKTKTNRKDREDEIAGYFSLRGLPGLRGSSLLVQAKATAM
jgi:hypothetical protein